MEAIAWFTEHYVEILAAVGGVVMAASTVVKALQGLVALLDKLAELTITKADDELFAKAGVWLDRAASGLDWTQRKVAAVSLRGRGRPH